MLVNLRAWQWIPNAPRDRCSLGLAWSLLRILLLLIRVELLFLDVVVHDALLLQVVQRHLVLHGHQHVEQALDQACPPEPSTLGPSAWGGQAWRSKATNQAEHEDYEYQESVAKDSSETLQGSSEAPLIQSEDLQVFDMTISDHDENWHCSTSTQESRMLSLSSLRDAVHVCAKRHRDHTRRSSNDENDCP